MYYTNSHYMQSKILDLTSKFTIHITNKINARQQNYTDDAIKIVKITIYTTYKTYLWYWNILLRTNAPYSHRKRTKKGFTSNRWLLSLRSASRRNLSRRNFHPIHQAPEKAPSDRCKWKGRPGVHFTYKRHQILRIKRRQATTRERRTNGEAGKAEGVGGYGAASLQIGAP